MGHQPDGNQKAAILSSHDFELRKIVRITAARLLHRSAAAKFGDFRLQVSRFENNLVTCPAHSYFECAMLARFQWRRVRFELQRHKRGEKSLRDIFGTGNFHRRRPRLQFGGRKNHKRRGRGSKNQRGLTSHTDLIRICITAESTAGNLKPVS